MNTFQLIVLGIFGIFLILGFLTFAGVIPLFKDAPLVPSGVSGEIQIWGTLPKKMLDEPIRILNDENKRYYKTEYVEKRADTFDREFVEALASGRGPDIVLLPQELILRHQDKVLPISYGNYSERQFKDTFIEEGELYLREDGILALPFTIDPMVMYWNRDIFASEGVANPPRGWNELLTLAPKLTVTDQSFNVKQSAVAFGEFRNVEHAKDVLAMLIIQAGNTVIERRKTADGNMPPAVTLQERQGRAAPPAESSIQFFTDFSKPKKSVYSWNRSLPNSRDFFAAGDLAMYLGYASELSSIRAQSPHLNFDVALMPQPLDAPRKATFGRMTGAAILKGTDNLSTAFFAVGQLTDRRFIANLAEASGLPPVRRDILAVKPVSASGAVFYDSALVSRAWLDPDPEKSEKIFRDMVENVVSGRNRPGEVVSRAHRELLDILQEGQRALLEFPQI